jgi:chromosome segregation ATPase
MYKVIMILSLLSMSAYGLEYKSTKNQSLGKNERIEKVETFLSTASNSINKLESKIEKLDSALIKKLEKTFDERLKKLETNLMSQFDLRIAHIEKNRIRPLEKKINALTGEKTGDNTIKEDMDKLKYSIRNLETVIQTLYSKQGQTLNP